MMVAFYYRMVLQESASLDGIANLIEGHVPDAKKARLYGRELSYVLPRDHVDRYAACCAKNPHFIQKFTFLQSHFSQNSHS